MEHIKLLIGWDSREAVGSHVFLQSVVDHCSLPIDVTILTPKLIGDLGVGTDGTNAFSKARFLAPYIYGFNGHTIFLDGADMLCMGDIAELWNLRDHRAAIQVVQHDYTPRSKRKYIGTKLEADNKPYPRKNWSSLILWHNSWFGHRILTPEFINRASGPDLHRFSWIPEDRISPLPKRWNVLIDEDNQDESPLLAHWTNGIPAFEHYSKAPYSSDWKRSWLKMNEGMQKTVESER